MFKRMIAIILVLAGFTFTSCSTLGTSEELPQETETALPVQSPGPELVEISVTPAVEPQEPEIIVPQEVPDSEAETDDTEAAQLQEPVEEVPIPEPDVLPAEPAPADLFEAVEALDLSLAEQFILKDTRTLSQRDDQGRTPLHLAAGLDDQSMITLLLKHGADPSLQDESGRLPLHIAAEISFTTAHLLSGSGSLIHHADAAGRTALAMAFSRGAAAVTDLLGEQFVNTADPEGNTPAHHAAIRGSYRITEALIDYGADINVTNEAGQSPLDIALSYTDSDDHAETARLLIISYSVMPARQEFYYAYQAVANKDVNIRFEGGSTPLHRAAEFRHRAIMRMLIDNYAYLEARDEQEDTPLHIAIAHDYTGLVRILVDSGADVDARDARNNSPLHLSIAPGRTTVTAEFLLDRGAEVNSRNIFGDTPLSGAMQSGVDPEFVQLLLKRGADPDNRNATGNTPIMAALAQNNRQAAQLLLDAGADIFIQNHNRITPLTRALIKGINTVSWFYRAEMNQITDGEGNSPLHTAVSIGAKLEVLEHIIAAGAELNGKNLQGETPLHLAVTGAYAQAAHLLTVSGTDPFMANNRGKSSVVLAFEKGIELTSQIISDENIHDYDAEGNTPLHLAALWNYPLISEYLIEQGAVVHARNSQGMTPLHLAVKNSGVEICRQLINHEAGIDSRDNYGNTPLLTAISWGASRSAKLLLILGADVELRNLSGNTPMHTAVLHQDRLSIKMLYEYGASLESRDNTGMTPLLLSTRKNYWSISELLISLGADYNTRDDRGNTPLHEAARNKNEQTCILLSDKGADIYAENRYGDTPLKVAFKAGVDVVSWFITGPMIFDRDNEGNTPLHTAIQVNASAEVISRLISKGADIDSRNNQINTPLHNAFLSSNRSAVEVLVAAGADLFSRNGDGMTPLSMAFSLGTDALSWIISPENIASTDQQGNTPLHAAAIFGSMASVEYLLGLGADPNRENLAGETPAEAAQMAHNLDIMNRLRVLEL
jgi:uncharacterized protein